MPVSLPNTTVADAYPGISGGAQLAGNDVFSSGWFTVANNAVLCEYEYGYFGKQVLSPEIFLAPGTYPLSIGDPEQALMGIRFRNAVPGKAAQVWGALFYPKDVVLASSSEFTASVSPSGGVSTANPGTELAYAEFTAQVNAGLTVVTAPSITLDGATAVIVQFYAMSGWGNYAAAGELSLNLSDNAVNLMEIGRGGLKQWGSGNVQPSFPVGLLERKLTPANGAHVYAVSAAGSGGVLAGNGIGGNPAPGFIRVVVA